MGGFGSGRGYRCHSKTTTDDVKSIDVRQLRKWGYLPKSREYHRYKTILYWTRRDQETGSIDCEVRQDCLILSFQYRRAPNSWGPSEQVVWFNRTICNYGGERFWFLCPHCKVRVALLYFLDSRFLCRHCYNCLIHRSGRTTRTACIVKPERSGSAWEPQAVYWCPFCTNRKGCTRPPLNVCANANV